MCEAPSGRSGIFVLPSTPGKREILRLATLPARGLCSFLCVIDYDLSRGLQLSQVNGIGHEGC
jgi:hypothetical protein